MSGQGNVLGDSTTGATSAATVAAGSAALPYTGGSELLTILSIATIVLGSIVFLSFVASRILVKKYSK